MSCENSIEVPVCGIMLNLDSSNIETGISEERVQAMIDMALGTSPIGPCYAPNYQIGVETRVNALRAGKQVYAKLVDCSALPNAGHKYVNHNISDIEWVSVSESFSQVKSSDRTYYLPNHSDADAAVQSWQISVTSTQIILQTGYNRTNISAVICLYYTKTTDPVLVQ